MSESSNGEAERLLPGAHGYVPFSELHRAYLKGKRAAKKVLVENPYTMPIRGTRSFSQRDSWKRGWLAGKAHNTKLSGGPQTP